MLVGVAQRRVVVLRRRRRQVPGVLVVAALGADAAGVLDFLGLLVFGHGPRPTRSGPCRLAACPRPPPPPPSSSRSRPPRRSRRRWTGWAPPSAWASSPPARPCPPDARSPSRSGSRVLRCARPCTG